MRNNCDYCGGTTETDARGNCRACGAPRHQKLPTRNDNGWYIGMTAHIPMSAVCSTNCTYDFLGAFEERGRIKYSASIQHGL